MRGATFKAASTTPSISSISLKDLKPCSFIPRSFAIWSSFSSASSEPGSLPDTLRLYIPLWGYWQAFQVVKTSVSQILDGASAGGVARDAHRNWYRELFQPCIAAGLLPATALAGYRNDAVYLRTSRYVPPRWEAVRDAMPALFDLLENEPEVSVRAVLGHWLFGYVHPYPDGNGRMARFLMNAMLASGGYPWTVIRVEDRTAYLSALDSASINLDIAPFANYVAERVQSMKQPTA
jgi:fido (protein-threonine AMPylation protein)